MNIYALNGHKVKLVTFSAGYEHEQETAQKHLELGKEYTVEKTVVHNWSTDVYLQEVPGIRFNSVFFIDVAPQPDEATKNHPDYPFYNRL